MSTTTTTEPAARAGRREWIGLAVLALPTLLLSLDMSVLYLALPKLSADLDPSSTQQLWIMDIYGFMVAGFLVTMGTLGDRIGRRRLLLIGGAAFAVASVLAAYSNSAEMLIATRALMGIAGATLMPSTLALIRNMFHDEHQRGAAIGVWFSCFMGGMTVGPLVGGVLMESFSWGTAFLLGVPVMLILLAAGPALLPEHRDPNAGRLDLFSVGLSLIAILPAIYGLKELAKDGFATQPTVALAIGIAFAVAFVRRQGRLRDPLLDMGLFANRAFSATLGLNLVAGTIMGGSFLLVTLYLQLVEGLSPLEAGLRLVPINVAMAIASMLAPQLIRKIRPAYVMAAGLVITGLGFSLLTQVDSSGSGWIIIGAFIIASLGIALPSALGMNIIVSTAPPEKAGSASSLSETAGEFGIAFGVATIGSIGTAVYRDRISVPAGVPADADSAAREGIEGAVRVAEQLPGSVGVELLDSAREAFTAGLTTAAGIGAIAFFVLAAVAIATLRHLEPSAAVPDESETPAGADESAAPEPELEPAH
ncbi:MFS transporter [Solicola gregarius]|uniref:MFS transporter n=1 Tax=Solicola gregarius TaxID=2908642 RepID=A0AA46YL84_9ACTN|nr:MFS transporter [Solicola gregarius]UYM04618.1 MFS transporter [Solicola gregarius]